VLSIKLAKYYWSSQTKEDEIDWSYSTHGKVKKLQSEHVKGRDQLGNIGVHGTIIIKRNIII
jgi:hypothetical protein